MPTRSLVTTFAALLCGCATEYHEPPADEPSARVIFSNVSAPGMVEFFAHSDNEECRDALYIRRAFSVHQGQRVTVRFPTTQELTLSANWGTSTESCRIFVTFRPAAGHQYAALYGHLGQKCKFVVFHDRRPEGGTFETEPSFRVRNANPWLLGKSCPPESQ